MKKYECNKCGREMYETGFNNSGTATVSFNGPTFICEDDSEAHLCPTCTKKLKKWFKGEVDIENDHHSGFSF